MRDTLLSAEDLKITYQPKPLIFRPRLSVGNEVIKNISFLINTGEIYGLIGESGCGKTTVAKALCGLIKYSGSIKIKGHELSTMSPKIRSNKIQMIFQSPHNSLNPAMKIKDILEEPLKIHSLYTKMERAAKVLEMLRIIGLDEYYKDKYANEMSGGQRQRISIGCALMLNPELIIADEVLSALDVSVQANILNLFKKANEDLGLAFIFISHDINVVASFCNRIAVMYSGEIVETGDSVEIYNNPMHPYTKLLIQAIPLIDTKMAALNFIKNENLKNCNCQFARMCPNYCEKCRNKNADLIDVSATRKVRCLNI